MLITILTTKKPSPIYSIIKISVSSACALHISKHHFHSMAILLFHNWCLIFKLLWSNSYISLCCTSSWLFISYIVACIFWYFTPILSSPSLFPLLRLLCSLYRYEQRLVVKLIFNNENSKQREAQHVMASCGHSTKYICVWAFSVTQLCLSLYNPMNFRPPGSSVHGIL